MSDAKQHDTQKILSIHRTTCREITLTPYAWEIKTRTVLESHPMCTVNFAYSVHFKKKHQHRLDQDPSIYLQRALAAVNSQGF